MAGGLPQHASECGLRIMRRGVCTAALARAAAGQMPSKGWGEWPHLWAGSARLIGPDAQGACLLALASHRGCDAQRLTHRHIGDPGD